MQLQVTAQEAFKIKHRPDSSSDAAEFDSADPIDQTSLDDADYYVEAEAAADLFPPGNAELLVQLPPEDQEIPAVQPEEAVSAEDIQPLSNKYSLHDLEEAEDSLESLQKEMEDNQKLKVEPGSAQQDDFLLALEDKETALKEEINFDQEEKVATVDSADTTDSVQKAAVLNAKTTTVQHQLQSLKKTVGLMDLWLKQIISFKGGQQNNYLNQYTFN